MPDRRAPSFQVPEWLTLPEFLRPQLAARDATTVGELPYRIEKALHFSNGGGVYAGTDTRDGRRVVLKEGRPHAGLAADGADAVARLAREIVVRRLAEPLPDTPRRRAGLLRGATGPALFLLRRYERTGEARLLTAAGEALRRDLDRCVVQQGGGLEVDEGWRTLPYLGDGSAGIGLVLDDWLAHGTDGTGAFERARAAILTAATSRFYAQPGLFQGRAGMILHLARTGAAPERLAAQVAGLGWFAMAYQGQLAFPGHQMMRLSMDLATGTAGCLLALTAALDGDPVAHLPFLPPPPAAPEHGSAL
ncbi:hypothetical protein EDD90_9650 [Streptomyces sp. Ag109_O5-1]|nr:hypothetical protein EDD90_9650 [Streptomyces sp. Ag109_O5-1]